MLFSWVCFSTHTRMTRYPLAGHQARLTAPQNQLQDQPPTYDSGGSPGLLSSSWMVPVPQGDLLAAPAAVRHLCKAFDITSHLPKLFLFLNKVLQPNSSRSRVGVWCQPPRRLAREETEAWGRGSGQCCDLGACCVAHRDQT